MISSVVGYSGFKSYGYKLSLKTLSDLILHIETNHTLI